MARTTPDALLPVIDAWHDCPSCRAQSSEFYNLPGRCLTCGQRFIVRNRKGDNAPISVQCPACEVTGYSWRDRSETPPEIAALQRQLSDLHSRWYDFVEPMVEALHGFHARVGIENCDVQRCREWMALRTEDLPTADDVLGILA